MTDPKTPIWVTIAVKVGDETRTWEADASTADNPYEIATALLSGLHVDAGRRLSQDSVQHWKANR